MSLWYKSKGFHSKLNREKWMESEGCHIKQNRVVQAGQSQKTWAATSLSSFIIWAEALPVFAHTTCSDCNHSELEVNSFCYMDLLNFLSEFYYFWLYYYNIMTRSPKKMAQWLK